MVPHRGRRQLERDGDAQLEAIDECRIAGRNGGLGQSSAVKMGHRLRDPFTPCQILENSALIFRHADGSAYGHPVAPRLIDAHAKVFSALRRLGFREGEVNRALRATGDAELEGATVERLLYEALRRIRPKAR